MGLRDFLPQNSSIVCEAHIRDDINPLVTQIYGKKLKESTEPKNVEC